MPVPAALDEGGPASHRGLPVVRDEAAPDRCRHLLTHAVDPVAAHGGGTRRPVARHSNGVVLDGDLRVVVADAALDPLAVADPASFS